MNENLEYTALKDKQQQTKLAFYEAREQMRVAQKALCAATLAMGAAHSKMKATTGARKAKYHELYGTIPADSQGPSGE